MTKAEQGLKAKSREKAHPKMGKLDIDYQVIIIIVIIITSIIIIIIIII